MSRVTRIQWALVVVLLGGGAAWPYSTHAAEAESRKSKACKFMQAGKLGRAITSPFKRIRLPGGAEIPTTPPAPFHASGKSNLIASPPTIRYLESLAGKLLKSHPGDTSKARPKFYVNSEQYFQGEAMFDHGIIATLGMIDGASEDSEVAFIMAHELSHLLLGHVDDDENLRRSLAQLDVVQRGIDYISSITDMRAELPNSEAAKDVQADVDEHNRKVSELVAEFQSVLEKVAKPVWTSAQEDEADAHGIELMHRAGYSPRGAKMAMRRADKAASVACEELTALTNNLENYRKQAEQFDWNRAFEVTEEDLKTWRTAVRPLKKKAEERAQRAVLSMVLPVTHRPGDERWKRMEARLAELNVAGVKPGSKIRTKDLAALKKSPAYKAAVRSAKSIANFRAAMLKDDIAAASDSMKTISMSSSQGRLMKRRLRLAQGKEGDASANLKLALQLSTPALQVYELYFADLLAAKRLAESERLVTRGSKQFGDAVHFLPEKIYMEATRDGGEQKAEQLLNQCQGVARRDIWKACTAAKTAYSSAFRESADAIIEASCGEANCNRRRLKLPWRWGAQKTEAAGAGS